MAVRPNFVNKQFNSPIKLYSQENVDDALHKQAHTLYNGAVGIDFHSLAKPGNLANSAVLRMLEEEESGRSGRKPDADPYSPWIERYMVQSSKTNKTEFTLKEVKKLTEFRAKELEWRGRGEEVSLREASHLVQGVKRVAWPPPPEESENTPNQAPEPIISQGSTTPNLSGPVRQPTQGNKGREETRPQVQSPPAAPAQVYHHPISFEPPKATVTLLSQAPIRQEAPPVFASQPATTRVQGGARMRGDQKWPPESVKQQSEAENAARIALAKGPACRPRRVKKDYSAFFAQHALNPTYPGYKAPPGTQHYIEEGTSNL